MALKGTYDKNGAVINNAHFRIDYFKGSKEVGLTANIKVFYNKAAKTANKDTIGNFTLTIDWDGNGNPYNLMYDHLKTIFTDATDD